MPKRRNISVSDLIEQGYLIADADDKWAAEAWALLASLRTNFDSAFTSLRSNQATCDNARIAKEKAVSVEKENRSTIEHSLAKLKQFIRAVADKTTAKDIFHTLGIDDEYSNKNNEFVSMLFSVTLPHLNDWDGTPQEIEAALKTEIQTGTSELADAVRDAEEAIANSTTATQERDNSRDIYEDILTQIRNWLYLKLPEGKYDSRLDEYGFEVWDKPPVHKLYPPGALSYDMDEQKFSWKEVKAADAYELQISQDAGASWTTVYNGADTSVVVHLSAGETLARVCSVRDTDPPERSAWSDEITIHISEPTHPNPPENLSVTYLPPPDKMVKVKWDEVAGADSYNVYRSVVPLGDPMGELELVSSVVSAEYNDHDIMTDITVYYSVATVQGALESDKSAPVSVDILP